ncbi:palmitoyltransferase PFA3 [Cordyceps fumosorosea ARSEF 2679]|uniref:Palmitoyltransferase n=1 Tax=Cordyceps fumosorosea (strain ARSEF 2679) TaxID=1081104 RepID=A0A167P7U9_CORFA|nr:palmitoyltransferase PFA3 [Cordyceps fumosorosea ARSEF 2679]OAA56380.1 palmitoyltransferase PFA3 [Cordyceps fumosorosea ARSEF 2679]
MARRWARRLERTCCSIVKYFPLLFVYGLTTWAVVTIINIGNEDTNIMWQGKASSAVGIAIYLLANWSYTIAVFTPAGSTTTTEGYGMLPTAQPNRPATTSLTVKSNGELRFCKKCQARKPDRAHHCSTCKRCVLKMDHHCPWLATCVGLRNYKAFLLFLSYTTLLCWYAFAVSGTWVWTQVISGITQEVDNLMPVNYIMLSVMSGIIGIVLGIFTGWHIMLSMRGQTTIECLEKTRYLSPLRRSYNLAHDPQNQFHPVAQQIVDFHTAALPGITAPEEGEEQRWAQDRPTAYRKLTPSSPLPGGGPPPRQRSYAEMEREQSRRRYEEYLDERDAEKLPSAFDLGWRKNMTHLLGPTPALWLFPICNTTGDGWAWEASPKWLEACDRVRIERERQRQREIDAGWGEAGPPPEPPSYYGQPQPQQQRQPASKADRLLGRDPNLYVDPRPNGNGYTMPLRRLSPRGRTIEEELEDIDNDLVDSDDEEPQPQPRRPGGGSSGPARMNSNGSSGGHWGRGGASGVLRGGGGGQTTTPKRTNTEDAGSYEDEGVD